MLDRALWITWYDLPDGVRDSYFAWLNDTYIPGLLARPGFLWAAHYASLGEGKQVPRRTSGEKFTTKDPSVPKGDRYILLVGGKDAHVFGNPVPGALHAALPSESREMLALRIGERRNIMVEVARVEGPEAKHYKEGMNLAPCIQIGSFQCNHLDEEEALAWYAQWRLPAMSKLAGCVRARNLASVSGWAKHSILYEFVSPEARNHFVATHEDGDANRAWTDKVIGSLIHAPGSANIARRIWPPVSD